MKLVEILYYVWLALTGASFFGALALGVLLRRFYRTIPYFSLFGLGYWAVATEVSIAGVALLFQPAETVVLTNISLRVFARSIEAAVLWGIYWKVTNGLNGQMKS